MLASLGANVLLNNTEQTTQGFKHLRCSMAKMVNLRARLRKVSIFAIVIDKKIICCYTYNQGQRLKRVR